MRINLRLKIKNITFFGMIAKTQTLEGMTSTIKNHKDTSKSTHIVMMDCEHCTLQELTKELWQIKDKYKLGIMYIISDRERSFRVWCMTQVSFRTLLKIILECPFTDWNFFYYTVRRNEATLRTSNKTDRPKQQIVAILKDEYDKEQPVPFLKQVVYDTGIQKRGIILEKTILGKPYQKGL